MAELKNIRHELFCRGLVAGKTVDEAYVAAGFSKNRGNAARLKAKESIGRRAAELVKDQHHFEAVDRSWVLAQLQALYKLTSTPNAGEPTWSPATAKAVLELIGKEHSMFIDRKIIGIKRLEDMGDDELRQIAGQVIEELDANVTVDGEVRAVEAELLEPPTK
jgi:hypothetical protein